MQQHLVQVWVLHLELESLEAPSVAKTPSVVEAPSEQQVQMDAPSEQWVQQAQAQEHLLNSPSQEEEPKMEPQAEEGQGGWVGNAQDGMAQEQKRLSKVDPFGQPESDLEAQEVEGRSREGLKSLAQP